MVNIPSVLDSKEMLDNFVIVEDGPLEASHGYITHDGILFGYNKDVSRDSIEIILSRIPVSRHHPVPHTDLVRLSDASDKIPRTPRIFRHRRINIPLGNLVREHLKGGCYLALYVLPESEEHVKGNFFFWPNRSKDNSPASISMNSIKGYDKIDVCNTMPHVAVNLDRRGLALEWLCFLRPPIRYAKVEEYRPGLEYLRRAVKLPKIPI